MIKSMKNNNSKRSTKLPRETFSKKDCKCTECGGKILKGQAVFIDPANKAVKCISCNKSSS